MSSATVLLQSVGLRRGQVAQMLGTPIHEETAAPAYLSGEEQRHVRRTLEVNAVFIVAMGIEGYEPAVIAACFGVSDESIKRRLRPYKLTRPAHRPKKVCV